MRPSVTVSTSKSCISIVPKNYFLIRGFVVVVVVVFASRNSPLATRISN